MIVEGLDGIGVIISQRSAVFFDKFAEARLGVFGRFVWDSLCRGDGRCRRCGGGLAEAELGADGGNSLALICSIIPVVLLGFVTTFPILLVCGFFVGIALASFSVGVGFVSPWYPPQKQGMALGVYGVGNIGQAAAAFGSPIIVGAMG
jgi:NNP family nitrate/nitrite transporter-like MFS transporter